MSIIEVTARAPDRTTGVAFMAAVGVAVEREGRVFPIIEAQITTSDDGWQPSSGTGEETVFRDGWFANVRYYGAAAQALTQAGDAASSNLFVRAPGLLAITEARLGEQMAWVALSSDSVPPGYENSDGVRLYDPSLIATRANVWA